MRAIWRENTYVDRVCDDAYKSFLDKHVKSMEEDLRHRNQRGIFERLMSLNIKTRKRLARSTSVMKRV